MRKDIYEMLVEDYSKESKEELAQRIISLSDIECEDRAFANECLAGNHLKNIDDALQAFEKIADLYHINTKDVHLDKALSSFAFIKKEVVKMNDYSRTSKFLEEFKNNMNGWGKGVRI